MKQQPANTSEKDPFVVKVKAVILSFHNFYKTQFNACRFKFVRRSLSDSNLCVKQIFFLKTMLSVIIKSCDCTESCVVKITYPNTSQTS